MDLKRNIEQYALDILGKPFTLYKNGVVIHGKPTIEEYDNAFQQLSLIESATAWWYGDLANGREREYGSLKEMAERLGINYNSLHIYQTIAKSYPELDMRMSSLTFNHHQIAAPLKDRLEWLQKALDNNWSTKELKLEILREQIEKPEFDGPPPIISKDDCEVWLSKQAPCDLLLTDPPYSTDINVDIETFAKWLPVALDKVKPSGHAYIFIGPYPREIRAYLNMLADRIANTQLLVWEYRNTMGPSPTHTYKNNWQAIIYYHGLQAPPLYSPLLTEQYSVHQFNMPNATSSLHHHTWEKPEELAELFIRHSTNKGDTILDPFAGTGTFLVSGAKFGRRTFGCDIDNEMISLALKKGCQLSA